MERKSTVRNIYECDGVRVYRNPKDGKLYFEDQSGGRFLVLDSKDATTLANFISNEYPYLQ